MRWYQGGCRPPPDAPIPADDHHKHFGGGQTETSLDLPTGTHTLQLLLADQKHISFDPPLASAKITVTVEQAVPPGRVPARASRP